jgi:ABC-2 type transport system permease protein
VLIRILNLVRKEFILLSRDVLMTAFVLTLPALQLVLLARATGSGISDLGVAVVDFDRSSDSRRLAVVLDGRQELDVSHFPATLAESYRLMDEGEVLLVVVIPAGFAADLSATSRLPGVQFVTDASNSIPAMIVLAAARGAAAEYAVDAARDAGLVPGEGPSRIDVGTVVRYNPRSDHKLFTIPAQVGFIVYQVTLAIASIGLARERELGTLEQLLVMPLRRIELVVGKAIPALVIGAVNLCVMLAVAVFFFGVPMRGSVLLLFCLTLLFIVAEIGYGILISGVARTQQQAILLVFVMAMVDIAFSGYLVRVKRLPLALRAIAQVVPFRHYLTIVRGVMLKGAGLDVLWPHAAAMLAVGLLIGVVAVRSLGKRLD